MAMLPQFVSRNGVFIPAAEASISVFNPAIYGAYGVYESMQVRNGVVFERNAHLLRLAYSAQVIELPLPAELPVIAEWIEAIVAATGVRDGTVRLFVIGPENGGETRAYIWIQPPAAYPGAFYEDGVTAITFEARRYLPQSKSLNTLASFMAQRRAQAAGVHEALLSHEGCLTEGSNSNLFVVVDGALVTAPDEEVLSGVTRDIVLHLVAEAGIPLRMECPRSEGMARWSECFITSTSRHVMPVTSIDRRLVGSGRPGPQTARVSGLFEGYFLAHTGPSAAPGGAG